MTLKEFITNGNKDREMNISVGSLYNNPTEVYYGFGRNFLNSKIANYYIEEIKIYNLFGHNQNNTPYLYENYSIDVAVSKKEKINEKDLKQNTYNFLKKVYSDYIKSGLAIPQIFETNSTS